MDRREFVAAAGAGALFPVELAKVLAKPKLPDMGWVGAISTSPPHGPFPHHEYPIYYMHRDKSRQGEQQGGQSVYKLWQPGIVMTTVPQCEGTVMSYCGNGFLVTSEEDHGNRANLASVIAVTPPNGIVIDHGFSPPYETGGDFWADVWRFGSPKRVPNVISMAEAEILRSNGHLRQYKPFCSFDHYIDARYCDQLADPSRSLSRKNATPYCEEKTSC